MIAQLLMSLPVCRVDKATPVNRSRGPPPRVPPPVSLGNSVNVRDGVSQNHTVSIFVRKCVMSCDASPPLGERVVVLELNQQQPTECVFTGVCSCVLTDFVLCLCEAPCSAAAPPTGKAHPPTRDQYNTLHQYYYSNYSVYISITVCRTGVPSVRQSCTRMRARAHTHTHTDLCLLTRWWRPAGQLQPLPPDLLLLLCKKHETAAMSDLTPTG